MTNAYTTKQVADNLALSASSIRNYCRAIEEAGYSITRNDKDQRIFLDSDVMALRRMSALIDGGKTLQTAAVSVAKSLETTAIMTVATQSDEPTVNDDTAKLFQAIADMQAATVAELKGEIRELRKLIEAQTELIEAKADPLAIEEIAAAVEAVNDKRGWWKRFRK